MYHQNIPGKKSRRLLKTIFKTIGTTQYGGLYGICLAKGQKNSLYDVDDNQYIDLLSGGSVMNLGYSNPDILKIYEHTAKKLPHSMFVYSPNEQAYRTAKSLVKLFPGTNTGDDIRVLFGLSGSDANDAAIKCARRFTGKRKIIAFKNAWHGSTGLSQQMNGFQATHKGLFFHSEEVVHLPFPDTVELSELVLQKITNELETGSVAAIMMECIMGDGGNILPYKNVLSDISKLVKSYGALCIVDEIQSGIGRTGKFWASEWFNFIPDLITTSKGITAGYYPLSACLGRAEIIESLDKVQHIFTHSANPVACAIAKYVIDKIQKQAFLNEVQQKSIYFLQALYKLNNHFSVIQDIRGYGLQLGIEIVKNEKYNAGLLGFMCAERGIYPGYFGINNEVLRIHPPLTISYHEIDYSCQVITECIEALSKGKVSQSTYANYQRYAVGIGT